MAGGSRLSWPHGAAVERKGPQITKPHRELTPMQQHDALQLQADAAHRSVVAAAIGADMQMTM